eukprot:TRINITY_DN28536_c0_g1_i3.p1 TRINITY_DN28536_c0_g1~~TRINITY_DN28536_c0_g1_i3.p1  ORF type:complete len:117 (-),score=15.33 TRINITY_DN28536_c0_g1_i3:102-452(-)
MNRASAPRPRNLSSATLSESSSSPSSAAKSRYSRRISTTSSSDPVSTLTLSSGSRSILATPASLVSSYSTSTSPGTHSSPLCSAHSAAKRAAGSSGPFTPRTVSYTHLTLPTKRIV